jgi:PAS domain-containing protein
VGHKPIELILLRQLASRLPMPVSIADAHGHLVYANPPAERLLGLDFATIDGYPISRFRELLDPRWPDGSLMEAEEMTLAVALHQRRPQQGKMILHDQDGIGHLVVTNAVPLDGQGGKLLGSMSIFWEVENGEMTP